ncbi:MULTISPECIES: ThiF family adenylyltransferase [Streptomyces]|uniref:ThiF family adenylyltransferase n=1 Tax=Streptomyces TaxID=1883 RepID=UPI00099D94DD|nr:MULTISPECIES: ThiF family adenylyltransferase [Streptomyces]
MSGSRLVRSSADLARLVQDGYAVRVVNGFLVIDDIPFVDDAAQVQWGSFVCPLDLSGDTATAPSSHVMCFVGGVPRNKNGEPIDGLVNDGVEKWSASPELTASCGFSQKPAGGYPDYYEKVTHYAAMVIGPAQAIDPEVTPLTFKPVETDEDDGVFRYLDTFSSRAGITEVNARLALKKVVIVGLGGTGAYLLDLLAKTPIHALHLYDGDVLRTHNAFRAPGAASLADLQEGLKKVEYFTRMYSQMRRHIEAHPVNVTSENVGELLDADFVFLAMDTGPDKKVIIEALTVNGIPFIDTGVGVGKDAECIDGQIRITTSLPGRVEHIERDGLISYFAGEGAEYDTNLQVAELNSFTANLAIFRYKKYLGFYADTENELHTVYAVESNDLYNRYGTSTNQDEGIGLGAEPVPASADAGDGSEAAA